jgi:hypothetical protein
MGICSALTAYAGLIYSNLVVEDSHAPKLRGLVACGFAYSFRDIYFSYGDREADPQYLYVPGRDYHYLE